MFHPLAIRAKDITWSGPTSKHLGNLLGLEVFRPPLIVSPMINAVNAEVDIVTFKGLVLGNGHRTPPPILHRFGTQLLCKMVLPQRTYP
jgi:hypothetical protein